MNTSKIFFALLLVVALSGFVFTECTATDIIVRGGDGGDGGDNLSGNPGGGKGFSGFVDSGGHGGTPDTGTGGNGYAHSGIMGSIYGGFGGGFGLGGGGGGVFSSGSSSNINGRDSTSDYGNGGGGGGATLDITNNVNDPSANIEVLGGSGGSCAGITYCGGSGGGGGAMLIMGGNALVNTITVRAGSGGDDNVPGTRGGGGGGGAMLTIGGTAEADTVIVTSGSDGRGSSGTGRRGGAASFTADTLKAQNIDLTKPSNGGDLTFKIDDTLGVNSNLGNTLTLDLDGTAAGDVKIKTIELGSGETVNVNSVRGGDFTLDELKVTGAGATYDGYADPNGQKITFDLSSVTNGVPPMLTMGSSVTNFKVASINFEGLTTTLTVGNAVVLLTAVGGSGVINGLGSPFTRNDSHPFGANQYDFTLDWDGTRLLLTITFDPTISGGNPIVTITPIQNNNNNINNNVGGLSTGSGLCSSPIIISISADPILGGARLSVETWSGDECTLFYQWQVEQNGAWINIPGATGPDYYYAGLPTGTYTVRCIVKNAVGEMISAPIDVTVS